MKVLIGCEFSGTVRDAFTARGHYAMSCDLLPTTAPGLHYQGDIFDVIDGWEPVQFTGQCDPDGDGWCAVRDCDPDTCDCLGPTQDDVEYKEVNGVLLGRHKDRPHWDMAIFHPPCTYLCSSGLHWNKRRPERQAQTDDAIEFVKQLWNCGIPKIAIENPIGCLSSQFQKPTQIIQPWEFGHPESKATCFWIKGLPPLTPTNVLKKPECGHWENQTPSGQNRLAPGPDRWALRSLTYPGIAEAMAEQWGNYTPPLLLF